MREFFRIFIFITFSQKIVEHNWNCMVGLATYFHKWETGSMLNMN